MEERKRIFVGGLFDGITKNDLEKRFGVFGNVCDVEIKCRKDSDGNILKTFGYVTIEITDLGLKKCFSLLNKTKWKSKDFILELAKTNFLTRLEEERQQHRELLKLQEKSSKVVCADSASWMSNLETKDARPGSAVPGKENWTVGKYGRVLPTMKICRKNQKIVHVDPSKTCHKIKKIKNNEADAKIHVENLTWILAEDEKEITKRIKGEFPTWPSKFAKFGEQAKTTVEKILNKSNDVTSETNKHLRSSNLYKCDSENSTDTDMVITSPRQSFKMSASKLKTAAPEETPHFCFCEEVKSPRSLNNNEVEVKLTGKSHFKITHSLKGTEIRENTELLKSSIKSGKIGKGKSTLISPGDNGDCDSSREKAKQSVDDSLQCGVDCHQLRDEDLGFIDVEDDSCKLEHNSKLIEANEWGSNLINNFCEDSYHGKRSDNIPEVKVATVSDEDESNDDSETSSEDDDRKFRIPMFRGTKWMLDSSHENSVDFNLPQNNVDKMKTSISSDMSNSKDVGMSSTTSEDLDGGNFRRAKSLLKPNEDSKFNYGMLFNDFDVKSHDKMKTSEHNKMKVKHEFEKSSEVNSRKNLKNYLHKKRLGLYLLRKEKQRQNKNLVYSSRATAIPTTKRRLMLRVIRQSALLSNKRKSVQSKLKVNNSNKNTSEGLA